MEIEVNHLTLAELEFLVEYLSATLECNNGQARLIIER